MENHYNKLIMKLEHIAGTSAVISVMGYIIYSITYTISNVQ